MPPDVALVLLAAGRASRFGSHKLTSPLKGKPLWHWARDSADRAGFGCKLIVTGPDDASFAIPEDWQHVVNPIPARGLSFSIASALAILTENATCHRIVIVLADMPFVSPAHLQALAEAENVAFSRYPDGHRGVPASFPAESFGKLADLSGDRGASARDFADAVAIEPADQSELADIDTPRDLAAALARLDGLS